MTVSGREQGGAFPVEGTITGEMMRTGTPLLFHPASLEEVQTRFPSLVHAFQAGMRSRLSVLLIARGEVIGSLTIWSTKEKAYGDGDIRLAQSVANQIAGSIANAQLFREWKRVEEALRGSEARYRELAELLPQVVFETDETGRLTYCNRQAQTTFGYTEKDIEAGLSLFDCIEPDDREKARISFARALTADAPVNAEHTALRKNGETFPVMVYASRVVREGFLCGIRGITFDLSSIRKTESELGLLRTAVEAAANGVVITDREGTIRWVNPAFTALTGYTADEAIGQNPKVLKSGQHSDVILQEPCGRQ